ncbi:hypothetical protein M440DRAFT_1063572 [Trichoderma longibrachiatum ATCC 18648]|uniref:Uncharacterized protein n=1 Tax=Trichoderma longibrachiatum ATCC 18648 TaxID=983965 RepID=A0A2T4BVW9_TRILO|nr:hypothetical protein M440DRAFT_1063572 [Trichoderma longibrachiatum ATCC 18648]
MLPSSRRRVTHSFPGISCATLTDFFYLFCCFLILFSVFSCLTSLFECWLDT